MKIIVACLISILFTSCEVYERYFIMATNRYGETKITVKVSNAHYLPKEYITASISEMGCNPDINTNKESNFGAKIPILRDTVNLQYSFTLPPCYTAWLQPTNVGIPHINYVVIDGRDTVATGGGNYLKYNSPYHFKKHSQQRFLLTIQAP
jgi:hypothetical protein